MRVRLRSVFAFVAFFAMLMTMYGGGPGTNSMFAAVEAATGEPWHVLMFTKTTGFRHGSIPAAQRSMTRLAEEHDFELFITEDSGHFTDDNLARYDVIAFVTTTGTVLSPDQKAAMERYIRNGGGFVGVHSASDTEYGWPFYGELVGAYFDSHPPGVQAARVIVEDGDDPSTRHLENSFTIIDEWYYFNRNPRRDVHVLQRLDRTSHPVLSNFRGLDPRGDHPVTWCHHFEGGRSWYTALGHPDQIWEDPRFTDMVLGGLRWAAGQTDGGCGREHVTVNEIVQETLLVGLDEPVDVEAAVDGRIFFAERSGDLNIYDDEYGARVALRLSVYTEHEHGLSGFALDPDFVENGYLYVYYSPEGLGETDFLLSRFTLSGPRGAETVDPATEKVLLRVRTDRNTCCHVAGDVDIGPDGTLYVSTGDNTDPFENEGFTPIDRRRGRSFHNAERTSSNLTDLRGKILRVNRDGSIPEDNPFVGHPEARPEIWAYGFRNPWRIRVDHDTGWVLVGNVGPDAGMSNVFRGPVGYDEFEIVVEAGSNHGWPHCVGNNEPYRDHDFATGAMGDWFDCTEATAAVMWYPYGPSRNFPQLGAGGRTAVAGPILRRPAPDAPYQWSEEYLDKWMIFEWSRHWVKMVTLSDDGRKALDIEDLITEGLSRPASLVQAPDGALYLLEYGRDWYQANPDARLSRIYNRFSH